MENTPLFSPRADSLSVTEARYYQDLLYRTVKIGTELEFALPKGVLREEFQHKIEALLEPSRDMKQLGRLGVFNVIKEHCGIEILITGRHPHWSTLVDQYRRIIVPLLRHKIRMRPTCGFHFHLLQVETAEHIPEIILANFWNMSRLFAPALKFLTSGGKTRDALCRRRQHNAHQEFIRLCPTRMTMPEIRGSLKKSLDVPEHQNFFNLEHMEFHEDGSISNLHIELRFPDGDLCPLSITAKTFLFLTMLLKAVEISKFGLLDVESHPDWKRNGELLDMISNNNGKLASSDTSAVSDEILDEFRSSSRSLLQFLKSIFLTMNTPGEVILQDLAENPVSLRRIKERSWTEINTELASLIPASRDFDNRDYDLMKIIELGLITAVQDEEAWYNKVAESMQLSVVKVRQLLRFHTDRIPVWNSEIGAVVFSR